MKKLDTDAYGHEMWDYYKRKEGHEIVERDDGHFDISNGPDLYFLKYKDWPAYEKMAMKHTKGKVLDIGCGAGRHALWAQKRGLNVLGVDNSRLAIKVCRLRGLKKAKVMSITQLNFKPNSFDTIMMMGNNFGLFGSSKRARRLLKKFYRITSKTALIIAESTDPYKTTNPYHLAYQRFNRARGRMPGQLRFRIRYAKYVGQCMDYLIVSKKEMRGIIKGTGWKIKKFINAKKGPSYIAILEKVR